MSMGLYLTINLLPKKLMKTQPLKKHNFTTKNQSQVQSLLINNFLIVKFWNFSNNKFEENQKANTKNLWKRHGKIPMILNNQRQNLPKQINLVFFPRNLSTSIGQLMIYLVSNIFLWEYGWNISQRTYQGFYCICWKNDFWER